MNGVISCLAKSLPIPDALNLYEAVDKIFRSCANLREDPTFLIDYSAFLHRDDVREAMKSPKLHKDRLMRLSNIYQPLFYIGIGVWDIPIDYVYKGDFHKEGIPIESLSTVAEVVYYAQECQRLEHEIWENADTDLSE